MIVHATTADGALTNAIVMETLCRQYLLARSAGAVRLLTAEEMRAAHERYRTYGQPAQVTGPRAQAGGGMQSS
jgi:L-fuculose-phosphate aldolase